MALMAIAEHHGRPHVPQDQAWIESFFGHVKVSGRTSRPSPSRRCWKPNFSRVGSDTIR